MGNNKIIIGNGKEKNIESLLRDTVVKTKTTTPNISQEPVQEPLQESVQEPLYENVWGNDQKVLSRLDEKLLTDRRFYTRVIYMQTVECNTIMDSIESEPVLLIKPIEFMIIDLSMGGIGVTCENMLNIGTILVFNITLDNIAYGIKCEVVYCFQNDEKFRAGLKLVNKEKKFIRHLKIFVARVSLQSKYGSKTYELSKG